MLLPEEIAQLGEDSDAVGDGVGAVEIELGGALGLKGDKVAAQAAFAEFKRTTNRHKNDTTIAKLKRWLDSDSKDPKYLALRDQTIWKGLRKAGVPEQ